MRLGDMLLQAGVVTPLQLNAALAEQQRWGGKLGRILVRMGALSDELLAMALSRQLNLPRANLAALAAVPEPLKERLDLATCDRYRVIPLAWVPERRAVQLAMSDPLDVTAVDDLRRRLGTGLEIFVVGDDALAAALRHHYGAAAAESLGPADAAGGLPLIDNSGNLRLPGAGRAPAAAAPPRSAPAPPTPPDGDGGIVAARVEEHARVIHAVVELLLERGVIRPGDAPALGGASGRPVT